MNNVALNLRAVRFGHKGIGIKTSVALIGFMGAGKTTVGKILARKLNFGLVETDYLVAERAWQSILQIFKTSGEIVFREMEIEVVKEISKKDNLVIACGGGVVLNTINIDRLHQRATIVYLYASVEEIIKRIRKDKNIRPLISDKDSDDDIKSMIKFRAPFYRRSADITINTTNKSVEQIVEKIINRLIMK